MPCRLLGGNEQGDVGGVSRGSRAACQGRVHRAKVFGGAYSGYVMLAAQLPRRLYCQVGLVKLRLLVCHAEGLPCADSKGDERRVDSRRQERRVRSLPLLGEHPFEDSQELLQVVVFVPSWRHVKANLGDGRLLLALEHRAIHGIGEAQVL